jgi:hypothetical protein
VKSIEYKTEHSWKIIKQSYWKPSKQSSALIDKD